MKSLAVIAALVVAAPNVVFAENQATQTGAYFGIGLGSQGQKMSSPGLAAEATSSTANDSNISAQADSSNATGGGQVSRETATSAMLGYGVKKGKLYYAGELDFSNSMAMFGLHSVAAECVPGPCASAGLVGAVEMDGRIRGILGFDISPKVTGFLSLGVARATTTYNGVYAHAGTSESSAFSSATPPTDTATASSAAGNNPDFTSSAGGAGRGAEPSAMPVSEVGLGLHFGLGAQIALGENLKLRTEILFDDFGSVRTTGAAASGVGASASDTGAGAGGSGLASDGNGTSNGIANFTGNGQAAAAAAAISSGSKIDFRNVEARISLIWQF